MLVDWLMTIWQDHAFWQDQAFWQDHALSILVLSPALGLVLVYSIRSDVWARRMAVLSALLSCGLSLMLWGSFVNDFNGFQFVERYAWVKNWGVDYHLGIDGIGLLMLVLTAFLFSLAIGVSANKGKHFFACLLWLEIGTLGVFCALDAVLFYVFWEWVLIPMYFLIRLWGSQEKPQVARQFFIITMAGSVLMLAVFWSMAVEYQNAYQQLSFNFVDWQRLEFAPTFQVFGLWGLLIAFGIKMPLVPLHSWQPITYSQAPLGAQILLSGILSKMGAYGLIRLVVPFFPYALNYYATLLWWLCAVGMVYASLLALVQKKVVWLIAYSSMAHLALIGLGIFSNTADGLQGAAVFMFNHGVIVSALLLLAAMLHQKSGTELLGAGWQTFRSMPWFSFALVFTVLASVGLPGLNGFVGEIFIFSGIFSKSWPVALVAVLSLVLGAGYMLRFVRKTCFGVQTNSWTDVTNPQKMLLLFLMLLMLILGLFPMLLLKPIEHSIFYALNLHLIDLHSVNTYLKTCPCT